MFKMDENAMMLEEAAHDLAGQLVTCRTLTSAAQRSGSDADWQAVLAYRPFWSLANDPVLGGVEYMTPTEIRQTLVEDLLKVELERVRGAAATYTLAQAVRHLLLPAGARGDADTARSSRAAAHVAARRAARHARMVEDAILAEVERGMVLMAEGSDALTLNPTRLQEAQDFAGVYMDLSGADTREVDFVDAMVESGGAVLLGDALTDLLHEASDLSA